MQDGGTNAQSRSDPNVRQTDHRSIAFGSGSERETDGSAVNRDRIRIRTRDGRISGKSRSDPDPNARRATSVPNVRQESGVWMSYIHNHVKAVKSDQESNVGFLPIRVTLFIHNHISGRRRLHTKEVMLDLPIELIVRILKYAGIGHHHGMVSGDLSPYAWIQLGSVCRLFRTIIQRDDFWQNMYIVGDDVEPEDQDFCCLAFKRNPITGQLRRGPLHVFVRCPSQPLKPIWDNIMGRFADRIASMRLEGFDENSCSLIVMPKLESLVIVNTQGFLTNLWEPQVVGGMLNLATLKLSNYTYTDTMAHFNQTLSVMKKLERLYIQNMIYLPAMSLQPLPTLDLPCLSVLRIEARSVHDIRLIASLLPQARSCLVEIELWSYAEDGLSRELGNAVRHALNFETAGGKRTTSLALYLEYGTISCAAAACGGDALDQALLIVRCDDPHWIHGWVDYAEVTHIKLMSPLYWLIEDYNSRLLETITHVTIPWHGLSTDLGANNIDTIVQWFQATLAITVLLTKPVSADEVAEFWAKCIESSRIKQGQVQELLFKGDKDSVKLIQELQPLDLAHVKVA